MQAASNPLVGPVLLRGTRRAATPPTRSPRARGVRGLQLLDGERVITINGEAYKWSQDQKRDDDQNSGASSPRKKKPRLGVSGCPHSTTNASSTAEHTEVCHRV